MSMIVGIALLATAYFMIRLARPREAGAIPAFLRTSNRLDLWVVACTTAIAFGLVATLNGLFSLLA